MKVAIIGSGYQAYLQRFIYQNFQILHYLKKTKSLADMQIRMILIMKIKIFQLIVDLLYITKKIIPTL